MANNTSHNNIWRKEQFQFAYGYSLYLNYLHLAYVYHKSIYFVKI